MVTCGKCGSSNIIKNGTRTLGDGVYQAYRCKGCGHQFTGEQLESFEEAKLRINDKK